MDNSSAVNSVYNTGELHANLITGCIVSGMISGVALVLILLAITSVVTLSTAGISTVVGISVFTAAPSSDERVEILEDDRSDNLSIN